MDKTKLDELKYKIEHIEDYANDIEILRVHGRLLELMRYADFAIVTPFRNIPSEYIKHIVTEGRASFTNVEILTITPIVENALNMLEYFGYIQNLNDYPLITEEGKQFLKRYTI